MYADTANRIRSARRSDRKFVFLFSYFRLASRVQVHCGFRCDRGSLPSAGYYDGCFERFFSRRVNHPRRRRARAWTIDVRRRDADDKRIECFCRVRADCEPDGEKDEGWGDRVGEGAVGKLKRLRLQSDNLFMVGKTVVKHSAVPPSPPPRSRQKYLPGSHARATACPRNN